MKTREYSIRARGINDLNDRPDIWEQLRSLTVAIEKKMLAKRRSPYMGNSFLLPNILVSDGEISVVKSEICQHIETS